MGQLSKILLVLCGATALAAPVHGLSIYMQPRAIEFPIPVQTLVASRDGSFWGIRGLIIKDNDGVYIDERLQVLHYRIGGTPTVAFDVSVRVPGNHPYRQMLEGADSFTPTILPAGTDSAGNLSVFYRLTYTDASSEDTTSDVHYFRIAPDGTIIRPDTPAGGQNWFEVGGRVHVRPNGDFVNTKMFDHSPLLFAASGTFIRSLPTPASPQFTPNAYGEFDDGTYVIAGIGSPHSCRLQVFDPDGVPVAPVAIRSWGELCIPMGVAVNAQGDGVMTFTENTGQELFHRFTSAGVLVGQTASVLPAYASSGGIQSAWLTDTNHVLALDLGQLREFDSTNAHVEPYPFNIEDNWNPFDSWLAHARTSQGDFLFVDEDSMGHLYAAPRCGDGIVDAGLSEECDDGNTADRDGCSAECDDQICGNSVVEDGEGCDDGNQASGDGCDSICRDEDTITTTAAAGVPVSTDPEADGANPEDPLEVSLTSPSGGAVSLTEAPQPGGATYRALGQQVEITAPDETAANPLVIALRLDASLIPGIGSAGIQIFRNGVLLADCADASGQANPDPCVASRVIQPDGDVVVTALSSHASTWFLATVCGDGVVCSGAGCDSGPDHGREQCDNGAANSNTTPGACRADCSLARCGDHVIDPGEECDSTSTCSFTCELAAPFNAATQGDCVASATKAAGNPIIAGVKQATSCLKKASKKGSDPSPCLDSNGAFAKREKQILKFGKKTTSKCGAALDMGYIGASKVSDGARDAGNLLSDLFGEPPASAMIAGAKCQAVIPNLVPAVVKIAFKLFNDCLADGLNGGTVVDWPSIAACMPRFDNAAFAKPLEKLAGARAKNCTGVSLATTFPGKCANQTGTAFDQCIVGAGVCRVCTGIEVVQGIPLDCDQVDDGLMNSSCGS